MRINGYAIGGRIRSRPRLSQEIVIEHLLCAGLCVQDNKSRDRVIEIAFGQSFG